VKRFLFLSSLLSLAACDSNSMTVHGRVLLPDGTPASGYLVMFPTYRLGVDDPFVATDAAGRYEVSRELLDATGRHVSVEIFRPDVSGAATLSRLFAAGDHEAPDVRIWNTPPVLTAGANGDTTVTWEPPADAASARTSVEVREDWLPDGPLVLWEQPVDASSYLVPGRALENRPVEIQIDAVRSAGDFGVTVTTPYVTSFGAGPVSLAREASCSFGDEHGDEPLLDNYSRSFCPLTRHATYQFGELGWCTSACQEIRHVTIDLGAPMLVSSVAAHALWRSRQDDTMPFEVAVSDDGKTFTTVGHLDAVPYSVTDLDQPTTARFVRLATEPGTQLILLDELAVF
jgi:hypothetical protein